MSAHYTSIRPPIRSAHWLTLFRFVVAPCFLIILNVTAWLDDSPWKWGAVAAALVYGFYRTGRWIAPRTDQMEVYLVSAALCFVVLFAYCSWNGSSDVAAVSQVTIIVLLLAAIARNHSIRIGRIEAPSASGRAAEFPGIYRITCRPNGKQYIGQTSQAINARWSEHRKQLASGYHHNRWLQADWNVFRSEQFTWEVLEVVTDPVWLLDRERHWQDMGYDAAKRYNPPNLPPRITSANRRRSPMRRKRAN